MKLFAPKRSFFLRPAILVVPFCLILNAALAESEKGNLLRSKVAAIFEKRCLQCHNDSVRKGRLSLASAAAALVGGESGRVIVPYKPEQSLLLEYIAGPEPMMPKAGMPLTAVEVRRVRQWIADGAKWPKGVRLSDKSRIPLSGWSLKPLVKPAVPLFSGSDAAWIRTPIDAFIIDKLREKQLAASPAADRRTLIRRLKFDLHGLPPSRDEIDSFVHDTSPDAYERLVDRLLAAPAYGERWARHWLDVVHYGDTHGFDKDKLRHNAWPYRDYVIRAFNQDKPYSRFVREQLAGDAFYPNTRDGIVGLGFIAAGPFDWVGQIEVRNGTLEKKRVRNLDRDDMVATTMNTFVSLTAQCARCHNHKFDPISQEDYYSLQAVFAAVDRADRPYDSNANTAGRRAELKTRLQQLSASKTAIDKRIAQLAGPALAAIDKRIGGLTKQSKGGEKPAFGYHSKIEARQDVAKWVQVDLGQPVRIAHIVYVGCHDNFNNIGAGFGFPVRYKIEISNDPEFKTEVTTVLDRTNMDVPNPGVKPQSVAVKGQRARYVRMTATKLALRKDDYIFALAELSVLTPRGDNSALESQVTALDSIEAPIRWQRKNLVDGYYFGVGKNGHLAEIATLNQKRQDLLERVVSASIKREVAEINRSIKQTSRQLAALPVKGMVFAAATRFNTTSNFTPTNGLARPIYLLERGSVRDPKQVMQPGTVGCLPDLKSRFALPKGRHEGRRRAALAEWILDKRNPLTWRSIVNRIWQYHFGRGIVDSPNDFGRMGAEPTHPRLLDWLAVEFRDGGQSIKRLHRLIVTSSVYRQSSAHDSGHARTDAANRFLWRMNRRRLEAEAIRDSVLAVAGKLDRRMGGPGFKPFGFKDDHSPHYKYYEHDPDDAASHRRSVYRFIVRSVPDPFMETLDCADPSLVVAKRNETVTALQALALLNNKFMVRMAEHFTVRVEPAGRSVAQRIDAAYRIALGRSPTPVELEALTEIANQHGLANACRLILNTNEFVFVD